MKIKKYIIVLVIIIIIITLISLKNKTTIKDPTIKSNFWNIVISTNNETMTANIQTPKNNKDKEANNKILIFSIQNIYHFKLQRMLLYVNSILPHNYSELVSVKATL